MTRRCLLVLVGLAAVGCAGPPKPPPKQQEGARSGPRVVIQDVELELTDASGERVWQASGKGLRAEGRRQEGAVSDLKCGFLEKGRVVLKASAKRGRVDWSRRTVTLSQGVHAQSALGYGQIRADRVTWSVTDRIVHASGNIEYNRGGVKVTAPRLTADTALKTLHLTKAVIKIAEPVAARKAKR